MLHTTTITTRDDRYGDPGELEEERGERKPRLVPARPLAQSVAFGLGWFSVGLGLTQLIAPGQLARLIGVHDDVRRRAAMRSMGMRELATGLAILASGRGRRSRWMWMRVAGDAVDLALLGRAMNRHRVAHRRSSAALAAVAGVTLLDAIVAGRAGRHRGEKRQALDDLGKPVKAVTTIRRSPEEVYAFWRNLENLPKFMAHVESVEALDDRHSHWTVRGPAGVKFQWEAEILEDRPGESITWRSLAGADVDNEGVVQFVPAPGGRGTEVHAEIRYSAPGGPIGRAIAKLFGREPGQQAKGDLRRLKQVLETGEVVHSDASIHPTTYPAQPPTSRFAERHGIGEVTQ